MKSFVAFAALCAIIAGANAALYLVEIPDHVRVARSPQFGFPFGQQSTSNAIAQSTSTNQGGYGGSGSQSAAQAQTSTSNFNVGGVGGSTSGASAGASSSTFNQQQGFGPGFHGGYNPGFGPGGFGPGGFAPGFQTSSSGAQANAGSQTGVVG